jgi:hypothetical protein
MDHGPWSEDATDLADDIEVAESEMSGSDEDLGGRAFELCAGVSDQPVARAGVGLAAQIGDEDDAAERGPSPGRPRAVLRSWAKCGE